MVGSSKPSTPVERVRRKPGASGTAVRLADGDNWLLRDPVCRANGSFLFSPAVDRAIDRVFEASTLSEDLDWRDLWAAARELIRSNYEVSDEELSDLLSVAPGPEASALASAIVGVLVGPDDLERSYTAWAKASLLANGLGGVHLAPGALRNVLTVLVATRRTVPLDKFAEACRVRDERASLEVLV